MPVRFRPVSVLGRLGGWSRQLTTAADVQLGAGGDVAQVSHLPAEVAGAFGINTALERVDRATAMTIPAVRRGRAVICGTLGALPLRALRERADAVDVVARPLFEQPDPNTTRQHVLTWTIDDLLFNGLAWWRVTSRDATDYPATAERIAAERIRIDLTERRVYVDGEWVPDRDLIRFDGPDEGVLAYGGRTLRTAVLLEEAVRRFARLDVPLGALKAREGAVELGPDDITALLDEWEAARRERTTAYLNGAVDYEVYAFDAQRVQLAEARQYQAAEIARLLNLAPRYVNAPNASGMTYSNVESERRDLVDTTCAPYIAALEQRLTMPDVTPRGQTARLDVSGFLRGDTLTALQGAQIAVAIGASTPDEVRQDLLGKPPLAPADRPAPAPRPEVPAP